jgi:twitching motility protein PilT
MSYNKDYIVQLLKDAAGAGATEVHLKVPNRPLARTEDGALIPMRHGELTPRDAVDAVFALCTMAGLELPVNQLHDQEFSFGVRGVGRFRVVVYKQRGSLAAIVQRMRVDVPTLCDTGLTTEDAEVVGKPGIVLVSGTDRARVAASYVNEYNATTRGHAWVLESPIRWLHRDGMASIAQREVGVDVPDYATGLRQAVRTGVNVIAVDCVPNADAADAILSAAESGACVVVTVAAQSAQDAPWWIARHFAGEFRSDAYRRLDNVLQHVTHADKGASAVVEAIEHGLREVS